jgi:hypothetical protein
MNQVGRLLGEPSTVNAFRRSFRRTVLTDICDTLVALREDAEDLENENCKLKERLPGKGEADRIGGFR